MKCALHEVWFTWSVLYMKCALHEVCFTWSVRYMKCALHEVCVTWSVLYMKCALHEDLFPFLLISCSFLLRMINVSDKCCNENQDTHFVFRGPLLKIVSVYEIMWKKYGRTRQVTDDNIIWRIRIACWIPKPTDTRWKHLRLIAFLLQQR